MDVGEMQRKLSQWATENPADQYRDLYSLLCHETWLRVAHLSVNTNQGRETAGIDGESMMHFNGDIEGNLATLRDMLKAKVFEPMPVRRVYIPKVGKPRGVWPLGVPALEDKIVQRVTVEVLNAIYEQDFLGFSYQGNHLPWNRMTRLVARWLPSFLVFRGDIQLPW